MQTDASRDRIQRLQIQKNGLAYEDVVAIEEPLEIRLDYGDDTSRSRRTQKSVSITMRTPGHDRELALGFLFTEGLIQNARDIVRAESCGGPAKNVMKITLAGDTAITQRLEKLDRKFYTTSSCGVCGKSSIEALKTTNQFSSLTSKGPHVTRQTLTSLPAKLRAAQDVFDSTGGLHACGLFNENGDLILAREDVGRHNALDKLIGERFLSEALPLDHHILLLSGRISFELVQKSAMAGLTSIAAVGAPSSLAVELARESKMTLIGFLRGDGFNVYTGSERLQ